MTESISPSRTWWLGSLDPQRPSLLPLLTSAIAASIVALTDARPPYFLVMEINCAVRKLLHYTSESIHVAHFLDGKNDWCGQPMNQLTSLHLSRDSQRYDKTLTSLQRFNVRSVFVPGRDHVVVEPRSGQPHKKQQSAKKS